MFYILSLCFISNYMMNMVNKISDLLVQLFYSKFTQSGLQSEFPQLFHQGWCTLRAGTSVMLVMRDCLCCYKPVQCEWLLANVLKLDGLSSPAPVAPSLCLSCSWLSSPTLTCFMLDLEKCITKIQN